MMSLNKKDLIQEIAQSTEVSKSDVALVLDQLAATAQQQLQSGNEVVIPGIGKLAPQQREERQGRNPATGESITIAAKTIVKFTATKSLKDAVA